MAVDNLNATFEKRYTPNSAQFFQLYQPHIAQPYEILSELFGGRATSVFPNDI